MPVPIQILEIEPYEKISLEILHITETAINPIELLDIKTIDHMIFLRTDQTITDQNLTTIKIDHALIHEIEFQVITIDKETTLNHHIGITHVIRIHNNIFIGVVHLKIKGK